MSESIVLWLIAAWSIAGGWLIVGSAWPAHGQRTAATGAGSPSRPQTRAENGESG